ncbi:hypothetical protein [Arthrobacter sp. Leaf137]|uniref:hypothetical protein n=1 Tax=Arthrobacter sp. Leaf137 TaxID=1736271 RepID=UPI0007009049|nr:hypothetical protein [Arthrobacter sp. Leaf137]KQQ89455.1 hypothetical protein ASF64_17610 [Arthrobacter sp. Leaf137]
MTPEDTALALLRATLEAPGTVTDTVLIEAVMVSADPQQHHLDTTKSLMRFCAGLLNLMGRNDPRIALNILESIETAYKTQGRD